MAYHNLYAIIIVPTAFVAMESARLVNVRELSTPELTRWWLLGIDTHALSPTVTPESV